MIRRLLVPIPFVFVAASSLCAQASPISLCIVQTLTRRAIRYDPPAGPQAAALFKQLSGRELLDGSHLEVTALPASFEKDIVPEISHVKCSWALQLWPPFNDPYNEFYFSLWNVVTHTAVAKGTVSFPHESPRHQIPRANNPVAALADKILDELNKHH